MARSRAHRGALRASSQRPSDHVEGRARRAAAARRPRADRRDAGRAWSITRISARARSKACGARRSGARRRCSNASGATTTGSIWRRAARLPPSTSPRLPGASREQKPTALRPPFRPADCRSTSSGCARPTRTASSRSRRGPAGCVSSRASRSARGSNRLWSRAARSTSSTGRRPSSTSGRRAFSRRPGLRPTTTGTSFTFSRSPGTRPLGRVADDPELRRRLSGGTALSFPLAAPVRARGRRSGAARSRRRPRETLQFSYALKATSGGDVGPVLDASILSDEAAAASTAPSPAASSAWPPSIPRAAGVAADFRYFDYEGLDV